MFIVIILFILSCFMPYALILLASIICKLATQIVIFIMHLWRPAAEGRGPDSQLPSQTTSTNTVRSYT